MPRRGEISALLSAEDPSGRPLPLARDLERPYAARTIEKPRPESSILSKRFDIRLGEATVGSSTRSTRDPSLTGCPPSLTVTYRNAGEERDIRRRSLSLPVRFEEDRKGNRTVPLKEFLVEETRRERIKECMEFLSNIFLECFFRRKEIRGKKK